MKISSAKFIKTMVGEDEALKDGLPQFAFIGRSNVGKSSTINALTGQKNLAITSSSPGRTQGLNLFLINDNVYFIDLPGYGFAKLSKTDRDWLHDLINWYLFNDNFHPQKVIQIIDAKVGPTKDDLEILEVLKNHGREVLVIANKIDKLKKNEFINQQQKIKNQLKDFPVLFYSSKTKAGLQTILENLC